MTRSGATKFGFGAVLGTGGWTGRASERCWIAGHCGASVSADDHGGIRRVTVAGVGRALGVVEGRRHLPTAYSADLDNDGSPSLGGRVRQMAEISGSCSLAYILDEAGRGTHRAKILSLIEAARSDIYPDMLPTDSSGGRIWDPVEHPQRRR